MSPPEIERRFIRANDIRLHCALAGPEEPPGRGTVLLLHGFPEFWFGWRRQIPALAPQWRVVAPDLRGYNFSDKPEGPEHYRMRSLVGDVIGLMDALGERRLTLVGHDWGGAVAWAVAAFQPERIEKLIILNAPHPTLFARDVRARPEQQAASQYMHLLRSDRAEEVLLRDDCRLLKKFVFETMADPTSLSETERAEYVRAWTQPGAIRASTNYYRAMPAPPPDLSQSPPSTGQTEQPPPVLISVPTLVIWGMRDTALLPSLLDGLEALVPALTLRRLPEATHWVQHDQPDEVNRLILDFLG